MKKIFTLCLTAAMALGAMAATEKNVIISYDFAAGQYPGSWGNESTAELTTLDGQQVWAITNPTEAANNYNAQFNVFTSTDAPLPKGETIYVAMTVKGSAAGSFDGSLQTAGHGYITSLPAVNVTTEWADVLTSGSVASSSEQEPGAIDFNIGKYVGTLYFSKIEVYTLKEVEGGDEKIKVLAEYDFDNGQMPPSWGNDSSKEIVAEDGVNVMKFTNPSVVDPWAAQVMLYDNTETPLDPNTTYYIAMKVKGSEATATAIDGFAQDAGYGTNASFSQVEITNEWKEVKMSATTKGADATAASRVVLNLGKYAGSIYFDYIRLYCEDTPDAVETIGTVSMQDNRVYNIQGCYLTTVSDPSEINALPAGLYIMNGRKYSVR